MTEGELTALLSEPFYEDFADCAARQVLGAGAVELLYGLVTARNDQLARSVRHKVFFRGAYVLDRIYFGDSSHFGPFAAKFCREDFAACSDPSARRHFTKIMADLLRTYSPAQADLERIADAAAQWAIDPEAKVAVKIGAVEVLKCCRERIDWVAESWDDLLSALEQGATPGIENRLRKSWR